MGHQNILHLRTLLDSNWLKIVDTGRHCGHCVVRGIGHNSKNCPHCDYLQFAHSK